MERKRRWDGGREGGREDGEKRKGQRKRKMEEEEENSSLNEQNISVVGLQRWTKQVSFPLKWNFTP